jgi:tRNA threonylcarbamoyladenosine biosynthesis protein TsaE
MTHCVKYKTKSEDETKVLAENLASTLLKKPNTGKHALVLALRGDLGSGKTTFAQGFALGLGVKEKITSPTFVILKKFKIPNYKLSTIYYQLFYHIDAYRLKNEKDAMVLGLKEILSCPTNIVLIEWPDRIKNILPPMGVRVNFKHSQNSQNEARSVSILTNF